MPDRKKKISHCPTCGAKTNSHKHSLSGVLMRGFRKALAVSDLMGRFQIAECGLNNSERQNLSKLKCWGIIEKQRDKHNHGGSWRITVKGLAFAEGMTSIQKTAITYRDVVQKLAGDRVSIMDLADGWKYRPEYARDARPFLDEPVQTGLFQ